MVRFIIEIRHCERELTEINSHSRLTSDGIEDAKALGKWLATKCPFPSGKKGLRVDSSQVKIVSSYFMRCIETARGIFDGAGVLAKNRRVVHLEHGVGEWFPIDRSPDTRTYTLAQLQPVYAADRIILKAGERTRKVAIIGETRSQLLERSRRALADLLHNDTKTEVLIIISHRAFGQCTGFLLTGIRKDWEKYIGGISIYEADLRKSRTHWDCRLDNSLAHTTDAAFRRAVQFDKLMAVRREAQKRDENAKDIRQKSLEPKSKTL